MPTILFSCLILKNTLHFTKDVTTSCGISFMYMFMNLVTFFIEFLSTLRDFPWYPWNKVSIARRVTANELLGCRNPPLLIHDVHTEGSPTEPTNPKCGYF